MAVDMWSSTARRYGFTCPKSGFLDWACGVCEEPLIKFMSVYVPVYCVAGNGYKMMRVLL